MGQENVHLVSSPYSKPVLRRETVSELEVSLERVCVVSLSLSVGLLHSG